MAHISLKSLYFKSNIAQKLEFIFTVKLHINRVIILLHTNSRTCIFHSNIARSRY